MKQIPNIFTILNLVFGCLAITYALQNGVVITSIPDDSKLELLLSKIWMEPLAYHEGNQLIYLNENLLNASIFIFISAIIDFADGFVARLFNATSEIGKQLDSLADVVSFGVAPSIIIYQLLRFAYMREEGGIEISVFYLFPSFIVACAGAYRLARFNVDKSNAIGFKGVPIPAIGLLVASFPLLLHFGSPLFNINEILINKWVLYSIILILSYLMVSNLPMMAMKFKNSSLKDNLPKVILVVISIVAAIILQWLAVPAIFITYIILSLVFKNRS